MKTGTLLIAFALAGLSATAQVQTQIIGDSVHITGAGSLRLAALVTFLPLLPCLALLYRLPESSQMELT